MPLEVVHYPHPALFHRSKPLRRVDADLRAMIREMFELMYQHKGVGLAANQVNLPYRLFVMNPTGDAAARDEEFTFINPVLTKPKGIAEAEEGCLSLPQLYADVKRPERVTINGYNEQGQEVTLDADDFFSRIVQHETDHLDGVLFVDRLSTTGKMTVRPALDEFRRRFDDRRARGELPGEAEMAARLAELERLRT